MRDAFGGTFMIEILMVFIVLFTAFTAVIVNVAKTFRIKNEVINIIEQTQYSGGVSSEVEDYIGSAGYQIVSKESLKNSCVNNGGSWGTRGYCILPVNNSSGEVTYYKVTVFVSISIPFIFDDFTIPISGETKTYYELD